MLGHWFQEVSAHLRYLLLNSLSDPFPLYQDASILIEAGRVDQLCITQNLDLHSLGLIAIIAVSVVEFPQSTDNQRKVLVTVIPEATRDQTNRGTPFKWKFVGDFDAL